MMKQYCTPIFILCTVASLLLFAGCRKEIGIIPPKTTQVVPEGSYGEGSDFYLLNEGNMGSNHCSLDYFNHQQGTYALNIYESVNPAATLGLGDVGNDIQIYGGKLYIVVNGSDKVEVLDKATAVKLCQISIDNCRHLAFWNKKVLITSYDGFVGVVDTARLQNGAGTVSLDSQIAVGREPEGLAVAGDQLYVANSGGYSPPIYDNTVSLIDLPSQTVTKHIQLGVNLNDVQKDDYGHIIVSARGDYGAIAPSFFILNAVTGAQIKHVEIPVENFTIKDSLMYYFTSLYNLQGQQQAVTYETFNLRTLTSTGNSFLSREASAKIKSPYALAVDPNGDKILISDAGDHTSPGSLYWIGTDGTIDWQVQTGEVPGHIAFLQYTN